MTRGANVAPGKSSADGPQNWNAEERRRTARSRAVGELLYTKLIAPGIGPASGTILKAVKRDAKLARWLLDIAQQYAEEGAIGPETEEAVVETLSFYEKQVRDQGLPPAEEEPDAGGRTGPLAVVPTVQDDQRAAGGGHAPGS